MVAAAKIAKLATEKSRCSGLSLPWIFCLRGERGMGRSVPDIARDIGSLLGVGCVPWLLGVNLFGFTGGKCHLGRTTLQFAIRLHKYRKVHFHIE